MKTNRLKLFIIALFAVPVIFAGFRSAPVPVAAAAPDDPAVTFKAKCAACHGATAAKWFDASLPETELVQAILKGKKGEKPPYMPEYESKGINEEAAKALVAHMKSLKAPSN